MQLALQKQLCFLPVLHLKAQLYRKTTTFFLQIDPVAQEFNLVHEVAQEGTIGLPFLHQKVMQPAYNKFSLFLDVDHVVELVLREGFVLDVEGVIEIGKRLLFCGLLLLYTQIAPVALTIAQILQFGQVRHLFTLGDSQSEPYCPTAHLSEERALAEHWPVEPLISCKGFEGRPAEWVCAEEAVDESLERIGVKARRVSAFMQRPELRIIIILDEPIDSVPDAQEGRRAREHHEQDDSDGEEVRSQSLVSSPLHFRRLVAGGPHARGQLVVAVVSPRVSGQSEVGHFECKGLVEENVFGLEVAMGDAYGVQVAHGRDQLPRVCARELIAEPASLANVVVELSAFGELEHNQWPPLLRQATCPEPGCRGVVQHLDVVLVVNRCQGSHLLAAGFLLAGAAPVDLEGASILGAAAQVYAGLSALAQQRNNLVLPCVLLRLSLHPKYKRLNSPIILVQSRLYNIYSLSNSISQKCFRKASFERIFGITVTIIKLASYIHDLSVFTTYYRFP